MSTCHHNVAGILVSAIAFLTSGCSPSANPAASATRPVERDATAATTQPAINDYSSWIGVYSSTSEIGGFTGTVLSLEDTFTAGGLRYRMKFHSDVVVANMIRESEEHGQPLVEGDELYLPEATGYVLDGKTSLSASITRYTRINVQGRTVLMRDDALREFRKHNRLYDYGILVKVLDKADLFLNLADVKHESIKVLSQNTTRPWQDPFVHGPNAR